jgi:hypothetical protein
MDITWSRIRRNEQIEKEREHPKLKECEWTSHGEDGPTLGCL